MACQPLVGERSWVTIVQQNRYKILESNKSQMVLWPICFRLREIVSDFSSEILSCVHLSKVAGLDIYGGQWIPKGINQNVQWTFLFLK